MAGVARENALAVLVTLSLGLLGAIAFLFSSLMDLDQEAAQSVRANAMWATYQLTKEARRFEVELAVWSRARAAVDVGPVLDRFEILASRVPVIQESEYLRYFHEKPKIQDLMRKTVEILNPMLAVVDRLAQGADPIVGLASLVDPARQLSAVSDELLLQTHVEDIEIKFAKRRHAEAIFTELGVAVALLVAAMGGIMLIQFQQKRRMKQSQAALIASQLEVEAKTSELEERARREELLQREGKLNLRVKALNEHLNGYVSRLGEAIERMASTSEEMREAARRASDDGERAVAASTRTAAHVTSVTEEADGMSAAGLHIAQKTALASRSVEAARIEADATGRAVAELADATEQIGSISRLIKAVADQTNLLALNATIEAVRAGQAGRGFAVVASEIKSLAHQTQAATSDIGRQIEAIQHASALCFRAMDSIRNRIVEMSALSDEIAGIAGTHNASAVRVAQMIRAAAGEAAEASRSAQALRGTVEHATGSAEQVVLLARSMSESGKRVRLELEVPAETGS